MFIPCVCSQGCKVNLNSINVAKARAMVKDAVPGSVVDSLLQGQQELPSAQEHGAFARNNPIEADVRREINRRIQALSESGQIFEDHAAYNNSEKDAEDARLIIQVQPSPHMLVLEAKNDTGCRARTPQRPTPRAGGTASSCTGPSRSRGGTGSQPCRASGTCRASAGRTCTPTGP